MSARSEGFLIPTARRDEHYHWQNYSRRSIIFYNGVFQQNLVSMSSPTTKTTYTLDANTIRKLEHMARRWGVSKSEALRRVVKAAAVNGRKKESSALGALDRLQDSLRLSPAKARAWVRRVRAERRSLSIRQEPRRR
jgi:membrane carboxypeptidase/penicillin-binding protein PbpC